MDDRATMMAYELFNHTRDAYRDEWKEEHRKKNGKGGNDEGVVKTNPYRMMMAHMGIPD